MQENQDYIFVPRVDVNEGITTGTVTRASMLVTAKYVFIVPHDSIGVMGNVTTKTNYTNTEEFLEQLEAKFPQVEVSEIEQELIDFLPEDRVFEVAQTKKLSVNVGFWLIGGMKIAQRDGGTKVINVQPKATRAAIKDLLATSL